MLAECSGSAGDGQVPSLWRCGVLLCGTSCEPDRPWSCNGYCALLSRQNLSGCVDLFCLQKGTEADCSQWTLISNTRLLLLAFKCQMASLWVYTYTHKSLEFCGFPFFLMWDGLSLWGPSWFLWFLALVSWVMGLQACIILCGLWLVDSFTVMDLNLGPCTR